MKKKNIDKLKLLSELKNMTTAEKEEVGLMFLMEQADRTDVVSREEVMALLNEIK